MWEGGERRARLIVGAVVVYTAGHFHHCVNPDDVCCPKGGRLGPPDDRPCEGINLIDSHSHLVQQPEDGHDAEDADAVGDEGGRVFAEHSGLAQVEVAILHKEVDDLRICLWRGVLISSRRRYLGGLKK